MIGREQGNPMKGREIFLKHNLKIKFLFKIYKLIPKFIRSLIAFLLNSSRVGLLVRYFDLKMNSSTIGSNVYIANYIIIKNSKNLKIGNNTSFHEFCYIDAVGGISIGSNVSIAHSCSLISFEHTWNDFSIPIKYNSTKLSPIIIGNDVWIGCGVRILAGSVIENRVVVAAGAVVKGRLESGYLYGGIPAKKLRAIL